MIVLRRLFQDRGAIFAIAIITIYVVLGVLAPLITFYEPNHIDTANKFAGISWSHWLGTDHLGRDVLTRIIYAIRPSLLYVFVALIISVVIGAILGFYFRLFPRLYRCNNYAYMRCDVSFSKLCGHIGIDYVVWHGCRKFIIAFILTRWAWFCRVIRTSVMQYIEADHVKFAKVIGMNDLTIIRKHILPLTFTDIAIIASSSMCSMILQMSGFSFLGLGVKAPTAEWG